MLARQGGLLHAVDGSPSEGVGARILSIGFGFQGLGGRWRATGVVAGVLFEAVDERLEARVAAEARLLRTGCQHALWFAEHWQIKLKIYTHITARLCSQSG